MTLLLDAEALAARRGVAAGALAPLAASLHADLAPLFAVPHPVVPLEKARLTRAGGRCPTHGVPLDFDPWSPRAHRCGLCDTTYDSEEHYRWWIMGYQLWLAERAVHAATLFAVRGDASCGTLAAAILDRYADLYLTYPNADNVLGPTRPFFSTYLESIWLLQLAVALDLLESSGEHQALSSRVRERIVVPSARLIASFDEGRSNRQVWNNAALAAAGVLLGDASLLDRAIYSASGLVAHAHQGLLADGTWYEGENYHLFAHRGLWYATTIAETQGWTPGAETARRIAEGFVAPFVTALPDFTFPSRRDSQYKVSLRQWRIAESCELGVARGDDQRLRAALSELYRDDVPAGDTGRARSTAEAERNVPAARLTRASLGWKSLLFAREALPDLSGRRPTSALLEGQGFALLRRDAGRIYAALDYGESGGGHGHPDRLNLWLVAGDARVLEDVGTGSYVDRSLHWYRSTLAHNAPLVDGRSQWRVSGELVAWDERGGVGWVSASAPVAPGVVVTRSVVVMPGYLVDELRWEGDRTVTVDLPWHVDATMEGEEEFRPASLGGGRASEDGFPYVEGAEHRPGLPLASLAAHVGDAGVRAWVAAQAPHEWWRAVAPGPPGEPPRRFLMLRARERAGCVRSVWAWSADVERVDSTPQRIAVHLTGGERHTHARDGINWLVTFAARSAHSSILLEGRERPASTPEDVPASGDEASENAAPGAIAPPPAPMHLRVVSTIGDALGDLVGAGRPEATDASNAPLAPGAAPRALTFALGREHYRHSEESWEEAGRPRALVAVAADGTRLVIEVAVRKGPLAFAAARADDPLDNEHPDINSDGVQLYLGAPQGGGRYYSWLLVPDPASGGVRVTPRTTFGTSLPLEARWREIPGGYLLRCTIPRPALGDGPEAGFSLDLIVNETTPARERRRGQLVLSGGRDESIYLRGDRQEAARALSFRIDDD